jgi:transcription initiation factor IIF auxiliary subunit
MTLENTAQKIADEVNEYARIGYRLGNLKLTHTASKLPPSQDTKHDMYQVQINLEGPREVLMDVTEVVYQLHPTFKPDKVTRQGTLPLKLRIWGEFSVRAVVHFRNGPPINLVRYLNLPG